MTVTTFYTKCFWAVLLCCASYLTSYAEKERCSSCACGGSTDIIDDLTICSGGFADLWAFGKNAVAYSWDNAWTLSDPSAQNPIANPPSTLTYTVTITQGGEDVLQNGDFEAGNLAFTSDYDYTNIPVNATNNNGWYSVLPNPPAIYPLFVPCQDHTSGSGNMLAADGASNTNNNLWCQTVSIDAGCNYQFSFWATSVSADELSPARLQVFINGQPIWGQHVVDNDNCSWERFFVDWNSGGNTSAEICIRNMNGSLAWNDFAIDDLAFYPVCYFTEQVTVTVISPPSIQTFSIDTCTAHAEHYNLLPLNALVSDDPGVAVNWFDGPPFQGNQIINPEDVNLNGLSLWAQASVGKCASSIQIELKLYSPFTPAFIIQDTLCSLDDPVGLIPYSLDGVNGIWSPESVFDPSLYPDSTVEFIFTPWEEECALNYSHFFHSEGAIQPSFAIEDTICETVDTVHLPAISKEGIPGQWEAGEIVVPAGLGDSTLSLFFKIPSGLCAVDGIDSIHILEELLPTFQPIDSICENGNPLILPNASTEGIAGSWLDGNSFNPAGFGGTIQIRLFLPDSALCASGGSMDINVLEELNPSFALPDTLCKTAPSITLPESSLEGVEGNWAEGDVFLPDLFTDTLVSLGFVPNPEFCASNALFDIFVENEQAPVFNLPDTLCSLADPLMLPVFSLNGFSGKWDAGAAFDPGNFDGLQTLKFVPDTGQCASTYIHTIFVRKAVSPSFNPVDSVCELSVPLELPASSQEGVEGSWSIGSHFNPEGLGGTSSVIIFSPAANECALEGSLSIPVIKAMPVTFAPIDSICEAAPAFELPLTSLQGVIGNWGGQSPFNPANLGGNTVEVMFTPDDEACALPGMIDIHILEEINPVFPLEDTLCESSTAFSLPLVSGEGVNGHWLPNEFFDPSQFKDTLVDLFFQSDAGQCASNFSTSIFVKTEKQLHFNLTDSLCSLASVFQLPEQSLENYTVNWDLGDTFDPAIVGPGLTFLHFTPDTGQCAAAGVDSIFVIGAIEPTFATPPPICETDDALLLPEYSNEGLSGTWDIGTFFNPNNLGGSIQALSFIPDTNACALNGNMTITVLDEMEPTFLPIDSVCETSAIFDLPTESLEGITGAWQGQGTFDPAGLGGTTVVVEFIPDTTYCASVGNLDISVLDEIDSDFNLPDTLCESAPTLTLPIVSNQGVYGSWQPFGKLDPGALEDTLITRTFQPLAGQCASPAGVSVFIKKEISLSFELPDSICVLSDPIALPSESLEYISGNWDVGPVFDPGAMLVGANGLFFTPDTGQCAEYGMDTIFAISAIQPTFSALPPICETASAINLPESSLEGVPGSWNVGSSFDPAGLGGTSQAVFFTPGTENCALEGSLNLTILEELQPSFSPMDSVCETSGPISLPLASSEGIPGTFIEGPTFDPGDLGGGLYALSFEPATDWCAAGGELNIEVIEEVFPEFMLPDTVCESQAAFSLPILSLEEVAGNWYPGNIFNPEGLGNEELKLQFVPDEGQCAATIKDSVFVEAFSVPVFSLPNNLCELESAFELPEESDNNIYGSWFPAGTIDPGSWGGTSLSLTFYPDTVLYCALPAQKTIYFDEAIVPTFDSLGPYCETHPPVILDEVSLEGVGGNWDDGNVFEPDLYGGMMAELFFTPASDECALSNSIFIQVDTQVVPVLPTFDPICERADLLLLPPVSVDGFSGQWGGGSYFDPTGLGGQEAELVFIADSAQCAGSNTSNIAVIAHPIANAGADTSLNCYGPAIYLDAGQSTLGPNMQVTWQGPETDLAEHSINPWVNTEGSYILVVEDTLHGCVSYPDTVLLANEIEQPAVSIQVDDVLNCYNDSLLISGLGSAEGDSISYQWYFEGESLPDAASINYWATSVGQYELSVMDASNGCEDILGISVEQDFSKPEFEFKVIDTLTCEVDTVKISAWIGSPAGHAITHLWQGPDAGVVAPDTLSSIYAVKSGYYSLTLTDLVSGCSIVDSIQLNEDRILPKITIDEPEPLDCARYETLLSAEESDFGPPFDWTWSESGQSFSISEKEAVYVSSPGIYTLTVLNRHNGCKHTDSIEVKLLENAPADVITVISPPSCFGDQDGSISVTNVVGGTAPYSFTLVDGNAMEYTGLNQLSAGVYELWVEDARACVLEIPVVVPEKPEIGVELGEDLTINLGESAKLFAQINFDEGELRTVQWSPQEDLECSDCLENSIAPQINTYINVEVIDTNGCVARDQQLIRVVNKRPVYIPNAFSPDGDGVNDLLYIFARNEQVVEVEAFRIFDRWGELVFERTNFAPNDPHFGWNGVQRGKLSPPGTYVYLAKIRFIDNEVKLFKGDLNLIR